MPGSSKYSKYDSWGSMRLNYVYNRKDKLRATPVAIRQTGRQFIIRLDFIVCMIAVTMEFKRELYQILQHRLNNHSEKYFRVPRIKCSSHTHWFPALINSSMHFVYSGLSIYVSWLLWILYDFLFCAIISFIFSWILSVYLLQLILVL